MTIPPLAIVAAALVLGVASAIAIIGALRRGTYRAWPAPLRWLYLGLVAALVNLGAAGLAYNYLQKWGALAAAWLLLAPIVRGLSR